MQGVQNRPLPANDLDHILTMTRSLWDEMRNQRLFITGGTGFFGRWLLESLLHVDRQLSLQAHVTVLTRDTESFGKRSPHIALHPAVELLEGDLATFALPAKPFDFIIHAAAEVTPSGAERPSESLLAGIRGMERVLHLATACGARKLLFTSSGAVYGRQPSDVTHVPEDFAGAPEPLLSSSVYGEVKRVSELMCATSGSNRLECKIARCFAFAGPGLPLDGNFALGNFIRDAVAGGPLNISGDGSAIRSYLYAADLAVWLWTILFQAPALRAFNVGSEQNINMRDLATTVASVIKPDAAVHVHGVPVAGASSQCYVPSTSRAREELGLRQTIELRDAIRRTAEWL